MRLPRHYYFNVAPRYSAGSPAAVDERIAMRVARDEMQCSEGVKEGYYGPEKQQELTDRGLRGIVYIVYEKGKFVWVQDVLTDELFRIPSKIFAGSGWTSWHRKSLTEMGTYLYRGDDASVYKIPLTL